MEIDANIYYQSLDGLEPTDLSLGSESWFKIRPLPDYHEESDATHELYSGVRYYGEHYERGPWPQICAALMQLVASPNVGKVWYTGYYSDGRASTHPITIDDILTLSRHYMLNGERPYRQNADRVYATTDSKDAKP